jgi:tetratricopeptide (TPR) repeat protein
MTPKEALTSAKKAMEIGDFAKASGLFAQVLTKLPKHDAAKRGLAKAQKAMGGRASLTQEEVDQVVQLLHAGEFQRVINDVRVLIAKAPSEALLHNIAGMAHQGLDEGKEAVACFRKAVKINPEYSEARGNLGAALLKIDNVQEAIIQLLQTTSDDPRMAAAWNSLANAYIADHAPVNAMEAADRALSIDPNYANANSSKGQLLRQLGRNNDAIAPLARAAKIEPDITEHWVNLGAAYSSSGQLENATKALNQAVLMDSNLAEAQTMLAAIYGWQGDISSAKKTFEGLIDAYPNYGEPFRGLSMIDRIESGNHLIAKIEDGFSASEENSDNQMHFGYALAKAYHDLDRYDDVAAPLLQASSIRRQQDVYNRAVQEQRFSSFKKLSHSVWATIKCNQVSSPIPVFIVGMNRSGTSLVEQIIASHSNVFGGGERFEFSTDAEVIFGQGAHATEAELGALHVKCMETYTRLAGNSQFVSDKLPLNFQWIGLAKSVFPTCKIVNLVRDPRDVALSNYRNYFVGMGSGYSYDLKDLAHYFGLYRDMMRFWHAEFPGEILDCCYEDLTENQEAVSRDLLKYLGLEWEDQVLDFHKTKRDVTTASVAQVRQKMYKGSVAGWRAYEEMLQPLIEGLNENGSLPYRRLDWLKDS